MIFSFKYQTATYAPGETERLDPVIIEGDSRDLAELWFFGYIQEHGGSGVLCSSCCAPLLVGETDCAECVELDKKEQEEIR